MSQEEIRTQITQIQELFKSIANEDSAEPRDFENDIIQLGEFSLNLLNQMKEVVNDENGIEFIQDCLDKFINEYLKYISYPIDKTEDILMTILDLIYPCLNSLGCYFNPIQADTIILIIINYFQQFYDVNTCGLDLLSCLASCLSQNFAKYLDIVWPYVIRGWNKEETNILKSTLALIEEISIASGKTFASKLPIVNQLLDCLENEAFNKEVKPEIYTAIGDIFLSTEEQAYPYLDRVIANFKKEFLNISQIIENTPADFDENLIQRYQKNIIESFSCIHMSFKNDPKIIEVFEPMKTFFQKTCCKSNNPSTEFLQLCLGVIADLIQFFKVESKNLIQEEFVQYIIQELESQNKNCQELKYYYSALKEQKK